MRIAEALSDVRNLYVESAPLIYFVEEHPAYFSAMKRVVGLIEINSISAYSSVIALAEVLVRPNRTGDEWLSLAYREILVDSGAFTLSPITPEIAVAAADVRARYNIGLPDALHVASAIETGCDAFLTNDRSLKRVRELPVLILDELAA